MLPDVKMRLKSIMEMKKVADSLRDEIERFSLVGFEVPEGRQKTDQLDFIVKDLMAKIQELEDLGVVPSPTRASRSSNRDVTSSFG